MILRKYAYTSKGSRDYWLRKCEQEYTIVWEGSMTDGAYGVDIVWKDAVCPSMDSKMVFPNSSGRLITGLPINDLEYRNALRETFGEIKPVDVSIIGKVSNDTD